MKHSLMDHSPAGSIGTCTKSGWINGETSEFWFDHFLNSVRPKCSEQPVLLVFDGHSSHTQNLNVVLKARDNNVILLCLPSHSTHRLQPLDVAFFRSLNAHYDDECRKWLREHQGQRINEERIPGLFSIAYGKSATVATAVNGFRKDFRGTDMTDQPQPVTHVTATGKSGGGAATDSQQESAEQATSAVQPSSPPDADLSSKHVDLQYIIQAIFLKL